MAASSKANLQKDYPTVLAAESFGSPSAQMCITARNFQGNQLQVTSPIFAGPDVVGIIQFGFNSVALDAELRSIVIQKIWQALALIAIGIVLSYSMARNASKPLRELAAAATAIGRGSLDAQLPVRGARETSRLGTALDRVETE